MFKHSAVIAALLSVVILTSGCINIDPEALAMAHPLINQFMREHPNADLRVIHYSAAEAEDIIDIIREDCGKLTIEPKEFYLVNITDADFNAVAWIDWENQIIECAYKEGSPGQPITECAPLYKSQCYGDYIYWFDSCGNREIKKEYCPLGCVNGVCVSGRICDVNEIYEEKPDCVCPEGYEMIVIYPRCASGITGAITGLPIAEAITTESGYVEISEDYTTSNADRCLGAEPYYRCVKREKCRSHAQVRCYAGHVYWFDSCGHVQEKKEYCVEGCYNGFCKGTKRTCEEMGGYCSSIACPEDAKVCDDGSTVGRVPPNCEFAPCPSSDNSITGMPILEESSDNTVEPKEAEPVLISTHVCREGYKTSAYWCPDNRICCMPIEKKCYDSDGGKNYYQKGVCEDSSGQRLSDHCNNDGTLTEKYCTDSGTISATTYECPHGCVDGACIKEKCAGEGELTSGAVSPEYYYECCEGLRSFNPYPENWVGGGLLCYDPEKGTPVCKAAGTDDEGWFYPDGKLLRHMECSNIQCTEHNFTACFEGHVYWYDSCENREDKKEYCEHGCVDGACLESKSVQVSIDPKMKNIYSNGSDFEICVKVDSEEEIYSWQFDMSFNSSLIQYKEVVEGDFLSNDGKDTFCVQPTTSEGLIDNYACTRSNMDPMIGISGTGKFACVKFRSLFLGSTKIDLDNVVIADASANSIDSISVSDGIVCVTDSWKCQSFNCGNYTSLLVEGGSGVQTYNIAGVSHNVELSFITSDGTAYLIIDGEGDSFITGEAGMLSGVYLFMEEAINITNTLGEAKIRFCNDI